MENYIRKYDDVLSSELCNSLIKKFEDNPDHYEKHQQGEMSFTQINLLKHKEWFGDAESIANNLHGCVDQYKKDCNVIGNMWPDKYSLEPLRMKRYLPDERVRIPLHYDNSEYTISFLLSDTKDFEGCEYYMFDKLTSDAIVLTGLTTCEAKVRDDFIDNYKNLPIMDYQQGDMVKFKSETHLHGTLPLTKGERYVLTVFYDQRN